MELSVILGITQYANNEFFYKVIYIASKLHQPIEG